MVEFPLFLDIIIPNYVPYTKWIGMKISQIQNNN